MTTYRLLRLGLAVALIVLVIGVIAAYLNIPGAFEIIWAALLAIAVLTAAIARQVKPPRPPAPRPDPPPPRRRPQEPALINKDAGPDVQNDRAGAP